MNHPIRIEWNEETLIQFIRGKKIAYVYGDNLTIEIYPPNYSESEKLHNAFLDGVKVQREIERMKDIVFSVKNMKKKKK